MITIRIERVRRKLMTFVFQRNLTRREVSLRGRSSTKEIPMRISYFSAAIAAAALLGIVYTNFAQQAPAPQAPMPAVLQNYQAVTADRLKNPEPGNWLMIRRTYD